jgi:galactokinase
MLNMTSPIVYVVTEHPQKKGGVKLEKKYYDSISEFILKTLEAESELSFSQLVEKANYIFWNELKDQTGWYLIHVKLDLEAKGLIRNESASTARKGKMVLKIRKSKTNVRTKNFRLKEVPMQINDSGQQNKLNRKFIERFGEMPLIIQSPASIHFLGEHTDYNDGHIISATIDKRIQIAIAPSKTEWSTIVADSLAKSYEFHVNDPCRLDGGVSWIQYLTSILQQLQVKGMLVKPINCIIEGDISPGAGLASSAALQSGFIFALNSVFDLNFSMLQMIRTAQGAEQRLVGPAVPITNHFAGIMGREKHLLYLDSQRLTYSYEQVDLKEYCLLLMDSKIRHNDIKAIYALRKSECDEGLGIIKKTFPEVKSFRNVTRQMLLTLRDTMPTAIFSRCQYIIEEEERVLLGRRDLEVGKLKAFCSKMFKTHEALSSLFQVSIPELDFLVASSHQYEGVLGSRMMGSVLGGSVLSVVHKNFAHTFMQKTNDSYRKKFGSDIGFDILNLSNGTEVTHFPVATAMAS